MQIYRYISLQFSKDAGCGTVRNFDKRVAAGAGVFLF